MSKERRENREPCSDCHGNGQIRVLMYPDTWDHVFEIVACSACGGSGFTRTQRPEVSSVFVSETRNRVVDTLECFEDRIFRYKSERAGPSVLFIGGTHGNEVLGILVVDMFRRELEAGNLRLVSGTVRLALGNPEAIASNERTVPGGDDLNRMFLTEVLSGRSHRGYESHRARVIAGAVGASDIVIDLHSTNKPSPAFVCSSSSLEHHAVYKWLPREALVVDPERIISGGGGSIDEFADDHSCVGICYESGQATDTANVRPVFEALKAMMIEKGMLEGELPPLPPDGPEYQVVGSLPYDPAREFTFALGKAQGFAPVAVGELIGHYASEPAYAPVDGVILFPKEAKHQPSAGVVCYLAERTA